MIKNNIKINNITIKNRIVMPPCVMFNHEREDGFLSDEDYKHYIARAKNDTGLIVVEATAVDKYGRSFVRELGLWDDKHIEQYKKLTDECHRYGAVVLVQLHHGGYTTHKDLGQPLSSSNYEDDKKTAKAMTNDHVYETITNYANAAKRAQQAGFDGVQLHGCHGFLINQFSCPAINKRDDEFAKSSALGVAIIKRIKQLCNDDFIICVRIGIDSPDFENGINTALDYQNAGTHLLSVSNGIHQSPIETPLDWQFSKVSYLAHLVKQAVDIPVVAVGGIKNADIANAMLQGSHCDMTAVVHHHL